MAEKHPKDRFDDIPEDLQRVGAHRAPRRKGRVWIMVGWAALATAVLIGAGIFGLSLVSGSISFHGTPSTSAASSATPVPTAAPAPASTPAAAPAPEPSVVPTIDPALTVNVLNGTGTEGLGGQVGEKLTAAGWNVGAIANADQSDLAQTIVYYSDSANQAAALGVAESLPGATTQQTQDFSGTGADITVVVGSDYSG